MILLFSGTGNSSLVARRLASALGEKVCRIDAVNYSSPGSVAADEKVIWVFPVHCWGVPEAVRRYISSVEIPGAGQAKHFLVATCGDDCGLTAEMWRKALKRRGWKATAAHSVFMPNTYVTLPGFDVDPIQVADAKMHRMAELVGEVAHAVKCSSPIDSIFRGKMPWIKTKLLYPLFMRLLTSPKPFGSEHCVKCGKCVKACPLDNVVMSPSGPQWGERCTLCLGCYHVCPGHHINYGGSTRRKGQWQGAFKALGFPSPKPEDDAAK